LDAYKFTRRATVLVASAIATFGIAGALGASAASASPSAVVGTTSMTNVPDTTNGAGGSACTSTPNGNAWATDQFPTVTLTATELTTPANTWDVTIKSSGTFAGFADPLTCAALTTSGTVVGTIHYTVASATPPVPGDLKTDYPGFNEFSVLIDDFFNGTPTITGGNVYFYSYQNGNYTQQGTDTGGLIVTGDVQVASATPAPTSTPKSNNVPTGGVQTGGGKPAGDPFVPFGIGLAVFAALALTGAVVGLRRQRQGR
jgi:hypothetical protein